MPLRRKRKFANPSSPKPARQSSRDNFRVTDDPPAGLASVQRYGGVQSRRGDLPDGQISSCPDFPLSSPLAKNFPLFPSGKSPLRTCPVPSHWRGGSRSSRTRGGMRWTRRRSKTSGADPPSLKLRRDRYQARRAAFVETAADGEVVWSRCPDAGIKLAAKAASDGGKKARSPGRARRKPLKPLRGECRVFPA